MVTAMLFLVGLVLLTLGANWLVQGASRLAITFGISPLVIGLTVVALGTSAPELAVSVDAALSGQPDLVLGNIIGSNIANILLILGLSAVIAPLVVAKRLLWIEIPIMIGASILVWLLALDGQISWANGLVFIGGLLTYLGFTIYRSQREKVAQDETQQLSHCDQGNAATLRSLLYIIIGLGTLVIGAHWLVEGAVAMARWFGVSELVIGLTIVAIGTSLPEVATSLVAAWRGERDIAIGNAVGSNIFNILAVLGITSIIAPTGISVAPDVLSFDLLVMVAVALVCFLVCLTDNQIARWEGGLFLGYYIVYLVFLAFSAMGHTALDDFSIVLVWGVMPLTALRLAASVMQYSVSKTS